MCASILYSSSSIVCPMDLPPRQSSFIPGSLILVSILCLVQFIWMCSDILVFTIFFPLMPFTLRKFGVYLIWLPSGKRGHDPFVVVRPNLLYICCIVRLTSCGFGTRIVKLIGDNRCFSCMSLLVLYVFFACAQCSPTLGN